MNIKTLRSDRIYQAIIDTSSEQKVEQYRTQMLLPFIKKWDFH
ncbi:hypothetical protein [Paenibacillus sp. CFBP13512]|nr:hypothetical protein [Paenibacillus sp. CFBP13512]